MRQLWRTAAAAGALAILTPAATAQPAPPSAQPSRPSAQPAAPPASDILVTGQRPGDVREQISDFVSALTPGSAQGQLGRFEAAACPAALGFLPAQKAAVERRLRAVAQAIGLPVGGAGCRVNMLVVATADKRAFLQALRRGHGEYLSGVNARAFTRLLNEAGPAAAWHLEGQMSADGDVLDVEDGPAVNRTFNAGSRLTSQASTYFRAGAVVIEAGALTGLTTTQVADYAAMRLLARTAPARLGAAAPPTILTVLEAAADSEVPVTLTGWDLGFLRGLYRGRANVTAPTQRGQIGREIARELQRPEGARE